MFENITSAVKAHKNIVIAAIAVSGLIAYSLPGNMIAYAQSVFFPNGDPVTITREIQIPCQPYCNRAGVDEPEDLNVVVDDILHLHIGFSFV